MDVEIMADRQQHDGMEAKREDDGSVDYPCQNDFHARQTLLHAWIIERDAGKIGEVPEQNLRSGPTDVAQLEEKLEEKIDDDEVHHNDIPVG